MTTSSSSTTSAPSSPRRPPPPPRPLTTTMFESYFNRSAESPEPSPSSPPLEKRPVFDKPVFDDDPDVVNPFGAIPLFGDGGGGGGDGKDYLDSPGKTRRPERKPESVGFDDGLIAGLSRSTWSTTSAREVEQEPEAEGPRGLLDPRVWREHEADEGPQAKPEVVGFDDDVRPGFGESTGHHDSTGYDEIFTLKFPI